MLYNPIIPEPQKDETGIFHCENCGMIISYKAHYCDACKVKREKETQKFFNKYWWVIVLIIIIILIFIL